MSGGAPPPGETVRAVLFDLDDTLHDDTATQRAGVERVAADVARLRPTVSRETIVASYIDQSIAFWQASGAHTIALVLAEVRAEMWARALAAAGVTDDGTLARRCGDAYNDYRRERLELFPEALGLLEDLKARGVKLGMITNGLAETHREKIVLLRLESLFDFVSLADEVGLMKPDARVFTLAAERLGVAPGRCAMVGDRYDRDLATPIALGMRTIWTNVRGETVPAGAPAPDADVRGLAGVAAALEPYLPRAGRRDERPTECEGSSGKGAA